MNDTPLPSIFNQQVGANLRSLRTVAGLSQTDLAEAMSKRGYSWQQQTVLKIEKGSRPLRFEEADALATVLGCTLEQVRAHDAVVVAPFQLRKAMERIRDLEQQRAEIDDELLAARERSQELSEMIMEAMHVER